MQPGGAGRRDDDDTLRAGLPSEREQDALVLELRVGNLLKLRLARVWAIGCSDGALLLPGSV